MAWRKTHRTGTTLPIGRLRASSLHLEKDTAQQLTIRGSENATRNQFAQGARLCHRARLLLLNIPPGTEGFPATSSETLRCSPWSRQLYAQRRRSERLLWSGHSLAGQPGPLFGLIRRARSCIPQRPQLDAPSAIHNLTRAAPLLTVQQQRRVMRANLREYFSGFLSIIGGKKNDRRD